MFGMSKKRIGLTFLISVVLWFISNVYELLTKPLSGLKGSFLGESCTFTGYPVAMCVYSDQGILLYLYWIINILIWFFFVNILVYLFNLVRNI